MSVRWFYRLEAASQKHQPVSGYDQYLRDTLPYHYLGHYFTNNS